MTLSPALRDLLALSLVPGLGPRLTQALLEHFGSPTRAREATARELSEVPRISERTAQQFSEVLRTVDLEAEIQRLQKHSVHLLAITESNYPTPLRTLSDAPHLLYARGEWRQTDTVAVAIVGSRKCTDYGKKQTYELARGLARAGYVVVSGLAHGIDAKAHEGALDGGGRTIAVLPGGLARISPSDHLDLADRVAENGLLLSEVPMEVPPERGMFHARNRLISGLALATVVIEANDRSGALITARHTGEQGRELFVLPANVDSVSSAGSLQLLRKGAKLIRGLHDLLEDLQGISPFTVPPPNWEATPERPTVALVPEPVKSPPPGLDAQQSRIWNLLETPQSFDQITQQLGLSASELTRLLFPMELKKWLRRLPGNVYERQGN
jgi:DNA processing protein